MNLLKSLLSEVRDELTLKLGAYVIPLALAASAIAVGLFAQGYRLGDAWSVGALCVIAAVSERGLVRFTSTTSQSISILPTLCAAVLFGPLAALVVGAASLIGEFGQPPHLKWVTYTSSRAIVGATTGLAAASALSIAGHGTSGLAIATLVGAIIAELLDVFFAGVA